MAEVSEGKRVAKLEAAAKLGKNHSVILDDILRNSGILRVSSAGESINSLIYLVDFAPPCKVKTESQKYETFHFSSPAPQTRLLCCGDL